MAMLGKPMGPPGLGMAPPPPGGPGMMGLAAGQAAPPPGMPPGAGLLGALGMGAPPDEGEMAPAYAGPITPDGLMGLEGMDRDNAAGSALLALLQGSPLFPDSPPPPGMGAGMGMGMGMPGMPPAGPLPGMAPPGMAPPRPY